MRMSGVIVGAVIAALMSWPVFAAEGDAAEAPAPQEELLGAAELDQLVAPIALYPDALLAQVLMASTYPLEVVQADRFAKAKASLQGRQARCGARQGGLGRQREVAGGDADGARHDE